MLSCNLVYMLKGLVFVLVVVVVLMLAGQAGKDPG